MERQESSKKPLYDAGLTDEQFLEDESNNSSNEEAYQSAYFQKPVFILEAETG